jgi:hypothetical protein
MNFISAKRGRGRDAVVAIHPQKRWRPTSEHPGPRLPGIHGVSIGDTVSY